MSAMGVSMLASTAAMKSSRLQSLHMPGGGPPAFVTRMSALGAAAITLARSTSAVMSPATVVTSTPWAARIPEAVASSASAPRALMTRLTPASASASAQPRPSPLDAAQTIAVRPLIPRSMSLPPHSRNASAARGNRNQP